MNCWFCGCELEWCTDFTLDEFRGDGDGVVAILKCPDCNCEVQCIKEDI